MNLHRRLRAVARRQPHADIAITAVVWAVALLTTAAGTSHARLDTVAVASATVACGVLVARRRYPFVVLLASAAAAEVYLVHYLGHSGELVLAAPLIALYSVAEASSRRRSLIIGVLAVVAFAGLHIMIKPSSPLGADNLALAALGALAVAAGDAARHRRAYLAEVEARAEHAEADREAEAARRVTEERLRIARDLHDVVGHQLALIHVQARVATHVLPDPPEQARDALSHIRAASKAALGELRDTIGLLRQPGDAAAPTEPLEGLANVDDLLASFRRSGLVINEHVDGAVRPVPTAVDHTAYRVVQESLTNVCKHTGPTSVAVHFSFGPDALSIVVDNPAVTGTAMPRPGPRPGSPGHGIAGMRERVTALGGRLHAGPGPDGGYRVTAVLPLEAGAAA